MNLISHKYPVRRRLLACSLLASSLLSSSLYAGNAVAANAWSDANLVKHYTMVPEQLSRYQPSAFPDRILLLPTETPAYSQTVNWRTNNGAPLAQAEIARAESGPGFVGRAKTVSGSTLKLTSENGLALQHSVTFTDLQPDTLYTYRVKGAGSWSEWLQFRTAAAEFAPFSLIYFGDAQNHNKSHVSRVMREALLERPRARLMLHAGDLISQRDGNHDNEWGEWFDALGWQGAMVNQFVTPGNHEYSDDDHGPVVLAPQFSTQFAALQNGPEGLKSTVYFSRYQGVLLISLNSTAAVNDEAQAKLQADWLKQVLTQQFASPAKPSWVVVTFHHPMFSVSEGRDNARLRQYWQPVFNQFPVDLVLQGHDHTYGRFSDRLPSNQSGSQPGNQSGSLIKGPVYLVSVAGPKMYLSSKQAQNQMQRLAEDTQLFQLIDFKQDRLQYQARTATGELYDAFVLRKTADGQRQIADEAPVAGKLPATRYCQTPLNERLKPTRCWNGTEFNLPQLQPVGAAATAEQGAK